MRGVTDRGRLNIIEWRGRFQIKLEESFVRNECRVSEHSFIKLLYHYNFCMGMNHSGLMLDQTQKYYMLVTM